MPTWSGTTGGGKTDCLSTAFGKNIVDHVIDGRGVCAVDPHGNHPDSL